MATITDNDLALFRDRAKTELKSTGDIGRLAWDDVVEALCKEVARLRSVSKERGDCAKLREALKLCLRGMCGYCRMDAEARGMTTECVNGCEALLMAKAALSAPPRNCDLYKTKGEAQEAFLKEPCDHPCGNCWVEDINNECGVEWLLAHATEKKAGDNGNE